MKLLLRSLEIFAFSSSSLPSASSLSTPRTNRDIARPFDRVLQRSLGHPGHGCCIFSLLFDIYVTLAPVKPPRKTFDRGSHSSARFSFALRSFQGFSKFLDRSLFRRFPGIIGVRLVPRHGNCLSRRSGCLLRNGAFYALGNDSQPVPS